MNLVHTIRFDVAPYPFKRPTFWRGRFLTPKEMRAYEKTIGIIARDSMRSLAPFDCPIHLSLAFFIERPERFRKRELPDIPPDLSNFVKTIEDGCNGIVWTDDRRIVSLSAHKCWAGEAACTIMHVYKIHGRGDYGNLQEV